MFDLIREISQTLSTNKTRTVLTGIAVSWGIFMLIVLLSVARGFSNNIRGEINSRNVSMLKVYPGYTSLPYIGQTEGRQVKLNEKDREAIGVLDPDHIGDVKATISVPGVLKSSSAEISSGCEGVYPQALEGRRYGILSEGRFVNSKDIEDGRRVVVLPERYAKILFPPEGTDAVGNRIEISGLSFQVIGIYKNQWNTSIYIPFTTARRMSGDPQNLGTLSVDLKNMKTIEDGNEVDELIRKSVAGRHSFSPKDENAVFIANNFTNSITTQDGLGIIDTSVWILGILTLLTGIVGVSNIMFVTVRERTHEIGIRRAIGAKPRKILMQILAESVSVTLIFGYIGIVAGTVVSQIIAGIAKDYLTNATVSLPMALEVTMLLVLSGMAAGLFPALKALKVKPVEALRDE